MLDDFIVWLLAVQKYNASLTYLVLVGRKGSNENLGRDWGEWRGELAFQGLSMMI